MVSHLRNWCRTDLYFLLRYGLKRRDIEHPWLFDRCREVQNDPDNRLDLWAREHYKSTIITYGLTIMEILASHGDDAPLHHPLPANAAPDAKPEPLELTFGIFSHTGGIATGFLRQIKQEFEKNENLKRWFPDVLYADPKNESPKWSENEGITVRRKSNPKEMTVEASGLVDGQPTSKHYKRLIYDDVVTIESVNTPEQIKKTTDAWGMSRALGAGEDGVSRYIGTRYNFLDTYDTIIKRGVKPRLYPATKNGKADGEPVFMSRERLRAKRVEMGAKTYAAQMLQDPRVAEDAYFDPANHRWYSRQPVGLAKYGASDFAVTANAGDFTVHGVIGIDLDDNWFILDLWREQTKSDVWVSEMIRLCQLHKPIYLWGAPRDQIRRSIGPFWKKELIRKRTYVQIVELSEAGDKPTKARSFQGRHSMGKVYFPRDADGNSPPWVTDLLLEMEMFPVGHDDQIDMLGVLGRMIDMMIAGLIPKDEEEEGGLPQVADDGYMHTGGTDAAEDWKTL